MARGKTTFFNVISGFSPATSGQILFNSMDITGLQPDAIARLGITRTFQSTILFVKLTVLENVLTGFHMSYQTSLWKRILHTRSARDEEKQLKERAKEILEFVGMTDLKDELAAHLPHGYQRRLGVAMALATNPKLLLLDEPATGMNPNETEEMIDLIKRIREKGITIILVEHDMKAVLNLCDRVVVLNFGKKIAEGKPEEVIANKEVIEAYLGRDNVCADPS